MSKSTTPQNNNKSTESATLPVLCAGGCNFYGNPATKNCCSLCFKKLYPNEYEQYNTEQAKSSTKSSPNKKNNNSNEESKKNDDTSTSDDNVEKEENKPTKKVQKKKNRCWNCRKKISLAGQFECKCGYVFCSMHRYPDAHECDFDYKKQNQKILTDQNQVIAPAKFEQI